MAAVELFLKTESAVVLPDSMVSTYMIPENKFLPGRSANDSKEVSDAIPQESCGTVGTFQRMFR